MLIARAGLAPGVVRDVRISGDAITDVADQLRPTPDEDVVDARGNAVIPGLHDHHVHLRTLAAAADSLDLGGSTDPEPLRSAAAAHPEGTWLRVVGFAGHLERTQLDELTSPGTPVRVQHRSGILWIFNTAALRAAGLDSAVEPGVDREKGWLWRRDDLVRRVSSLTREQLAAVGTRATELGITAFTDATPDGDPAELTRDLRAAGVTQRLHLMGPVGSTTHAPVKVLLDDDALPAIDELTETVCAAHDEGRIVAFHCVTRVQLVVAMTALDAAGARHDRIEHASVVPVELIADLHRLGVTVVTQPHFIAERGDDYLRDVDSEDHDSLYRVQSLLDAGIPVVAGTDAPFGTFDPWASMAAAVERRTRGGHVLGPRERVDVETAMRLYADATIAPGQPAAVCVLEVPWRGLPTSLRDRPVRQVLT